MLGSEEMCRVETMNVLGGRTNKEYDVEMFQRV